MGRFLIFLISFLACHAYSCSCGRVLIDEHVNRADVIYIGFLASAKVVEMDDQDDMWYLEGTINVKDVIKGAVGKIDIVKTGKGYGDCGIPLTVGRWYIIFRNKDKEIYIGSCGESGTINTYMDEEYIEKLKSEVAKEP